MTDSAVEARELVKTYPRGVRALDGLTFTVRTGTLFGLLGPNGAGKPTAVKILTTLSRADSGVAIVGGYDVRRDADRVRRVIGVVGQKLSGDPNGTGRENVTLQGRLCGIRGRTLTRRVDDLLQRLDLTSAANRSVRTYSGGMKRRLDLAMGLIHQPRILFLDEPTTGLDPDIRVQLWDELARLLRDDGLTVVLTTHYLEEADHLAHQVAIVDAGRTVVSGSPDELKSRLRGDSLQIDLARPPADVEVKQALDPLPGMGEFHVDGKRLYARVDDGAAAVPAVLAALDRQGMSATAVTLSRPSLDDVYMAYTGKTFGGGAPTDGGRL